MLITRKEIRLEVIWILRQHFGENRKSVVNPSGPREVIGSLFENR